MQKTKIVATIGPATQSEKTMTALYNSGASFFRLNMSHGDHATHQTTVDLARAIEKKQKVLVGLICDLCGPKIRIGDFANGEITLTKGKTFILTTRKILGDETQVYINYPALTKDLKPGDTILLEDGKKNLLVTKKLNDTDLETKVIYGGHTKSRRGVNIPNANLSISALTPKDKKDVEWGVKQDFTYFAISFVRNAKDISELRKLLAKYKSKAKIIAKIETPEAVKNIDEIIAVTDAVMVARGDLAIEVGPENVPYIQKQIIRKCNDAGKPVITATQMLESMVRNQVPTRAEVSDVANAILDGTDAVMLSEETAVGEFPLETVAIMARTALKAESTILTHRRITVAENNLVDSVSSSVVHVAEDINAKLIAVLTESGGTARMISRHRPTQPIYAFTPHDFSARQVMLSYGVTPILTGIFAGVTSATTGIQKELLHEKLVKKGDHIILSAGVPFGQPGSTNMMLVVTI
jgi:pyruvate kinase